MKYELHYSCKHYFGLVTVEAENKEQAILAGTEKIKCEHQSTPKTRAECKKTCGLKFKN